MTNDELRAEVRAIADLHQRLGDHIETLTRRLHRHFDAGAGVGKNDYRLTMTPGRHEQAFARKMARDDEDDFGGD